MSRSKRKRLENEHDLENEQNQGEMETLRANKKPKKREQDIQSNSELNIVEENELRQGAKKRHKTKKDQAVPESYSSDEREKHQHKFSRLHRQPTTKMHWVRSDSDSVDSDSSNPEFLKSPKKNRRKSKKARTEPISEEMQMDSPNVKADSLMQKEQLENVPTASSRASSVEITEVLSPRKSQRIRSQHKPLSSGAEMAPNFPSLPAATVPPPSNKKIPKSGTTPHPMIVRSSSKAERPRGQRGVSLPATDMIHLADGREGMGAGTGFGLYDHVMPHEIRDRNLILPKSSNLVERTLIAPEPMIVPPKPPPVVKPPVNLASKAKTSHAGASTQGSLRSAMKGKKRREKRQEFTKDIMAARTPQRRRALQQMWTAEAWGKKFQTVPKPIEEKQRFHPIQALKDKLELSIPIKDSPLWMKLMTIWLLILSALLLWLAKPENIARWCGMFGLLYKPQVRLPHIKSLVREQMVLMNLDIPDLSKLLASYKPPTEEIKQLESELLETSSKFTAFEDSFGQNLNADIPWAVKRLEATWDEVRSNDEVTKLAARKLTSQMEREMEGLSQRINDLVTARRMLVAVNVDKEPNRLWQGIHSRTARIAKIEEELHTLNEKLSSALMKSELPLMIENMRSLVPNFSHMTPRQKKLLTKLDALIDRELAEYEVEKEIDGMNLQQVQNLVSEFLEAYSHDKVGLPNLAARRFGALIVNGKKFTSPSYQSGESMMTYFRFSGVAAGGSPEIILSMDDRFEDCWKFQGVHGFVTIDLAKATKPLFVSMEHASYADVLDLSSAPHHFRVFGYQAPHWENPYHLGDFTYKIGQSPNQVFSVEDFASNKSTSRIKLEVLSNHGHKNYTCLYRFRVHGTLV